MAGRWRTAVIPGVNDLLERGPTLRVFVSYSSSDDAHRQQLDRFLKPFVRAGIVEIWHDRKIEPGQEWGTAIAQELQSADVIVLLVSSAFLASDYCYEKEMTRALERHDRGEARVIPVILATCSWESSPFAKLQVLPDRAKPLSKYGRRDEAWTQIAKAIVGTSPRASRVATTVTQTPPPAPPADPTPYLTWLRDQHSHLDIRGMGAQVTERMELDRVYTRLSVETPANDRRPESAHSASHKRATEDELVRIDDPERHTRELRHVLPGHPHAALIGDPGSGKTTFLRFVAQRLARAHLGETNSLDDLGLTGNAPFPIFVRLADVARFLADHPANALPDDRPEHLYRLLDQSLDGLHLDVPSDFLRQRLCTGNCMLLLDGLDEVPGESMRRRMVQLIEQVVTHGKRVHNRHLITCRTRAYQGQVQFVASVTAMPLAPLGEEEVDAFISSWARALYKVPAGVPDEAPEAREAMVYRASLAEAIAQNPSRDTFTRSPLMLTVLAVVHWNKKRLPEQRAELYEAAVEYLLDSRKEHSKHEMPVRRECLQAIALRMFTDTEGVQRTLGRRDAARAVQALLGGTLPHAEAFVEDEELYSGLLVSRTEGEVEFWHLTFQEYLAARELSPLADDRWKTLATHLHDDRWAELVLLLAGCERRQGLREARRLIERILATGTDVVSTAKACGLVGRILRDIKPYGLDASQGTNFVERLHGLLPIFEPGAPDVEERVRVEVGDALGVAGDPRLRDREANKVLIPGGTFWMGAQDKDRSGRNYDEEALRGESPVHQVTVSSFRIGRFPVTVGEFAEFVEAGERGYLARANWSDEGWSLRAQNSRTEPWNWSGQARLPNRPVVGVSWFEAAAYAAWAGGRLPTEAEWEWVARGAGGRKYPWGDEPPTERHANFNYRLRTVSPVGIYPDDTNEFGIRDLAGNVWEWVSDWWAAYKPAPAIDPTGPSGGPSRVLRGGSFGADARSLRGADRNFIPPEDVVHFIGFRVVWSAAGGQT
jgi:formylglycine-generating enzyme required for sulfatase activity